MHELVPFLVHARQRTPSQEAHRQQRHNDRLQDLHTFCLRNGTDCEGEDSSTTTTDSCHESDRSDMQVSRQESCRCNNRGGEKRSKEESLERDGDD